MRRHIITTAIAAAAALTACGGGSGSSSPASPKVLADKIGCTGYSTDDQTELFVRNQGSCTLGDSTLTIYTFTSSDDRDKWVKAAAAFGSSAQVVGSDWIVLPDGGDTDAAAAAVKAKAGGDIK